MVPELDAVTEDRLLGGRIVLRQRAGGHRAGTDAVLVARLAEARPNESVVDLGSASGAVGLMVAATVPDTRVVLAERDPELVGLARANIALNGVADRVFASPFDAFAPPATWGETWARDGVPIGGADLVVTNPPYFDVASRPSPDPSRRAAHVMEGGTLTNWIAAAARLLRAKGRLALIYRADGLPTVLSALESGFGSVRVRTVHPRADAPASRIVGWARKGGKGAFSLLPPLVLHGDDGRFTAEARDLHRL